MIKNNVNISEVLQNKWEIFQSRYDGKYTKTTQFLLSSLELKITASLLCWLENAFIDDANHAHNYTRPIFLLFKVREDKEWDKTYQYLITHENYVNDYNVGMDGTDDLVMVVFSVPKKFQNEYFHFKQGRYTKFSEEYKKKFPKYLSSQKEKGGKKEATVWQILHNTKSLKRKLEEEFGLSENFLDEQDEIWDIPRKSREVFNYKSNNNDE